MQAFEIADLLTRQSASGSPYLEFLKHLSLSVGLYVLPAGGMDGQQPHTEDEVYYVVSGRGMFRHADEDRPVQAGSVLYVAANVEHRFHSITEALQIIVFFAPAEYTNRKP
ncbi:MAG: cupin domain-containing protein [Chloroflexi bacterium]|nr:cupin domain-containing protein [Chloroflexota bacterium]MCC6892974.1 cupin domain-containing protein [Anaerolineae bacterium]